MADDNVEDKDLFGNSEDEDGSPAQGYFSNELDAESAAVDAYWKKVVGLFLNDSEESVENMLIQLGWQSLTTTYKTNIETRSVGRDIQRVAAEVLRGDDIESVNATISETLQTYGQIMFLSNQLSMWGFLRKLHNLKVLKFDPIDWESMLAHPRGKNTREDEIKRLKDSFEQACQSFNDEASRLPDVLNDAALEDSLDEANPLFIQCMKELPSIEGFDQLLGWRKIRWSLEVIKDTIGSYRTLVERIGRQDATLEDRFRFPTLNDQAEASKLVRKEYECLMSVFIDDMKREIETPFPFDNVKRCLESGVVGDGTALSTSDRECMERSVSRRIYDADALLPDTIAVNAVRCSALVTKWRLDAGASTDCEMYVLLVADVGGVFGHPKVRQWRSTSIDRAEFLIYRGTTTMGMYTTRPCYIYAIKDFRLQNGEIGQNGIKAAGLAYQINKVAASISPHVEKLYQHHGSSSLGTKTDVSDVTKICPEKSNPWDGFVYGRFEGNMAINPVIRGHELLYMHQEDSPYNVSPPYVSTLDNEGVSDEHPYLVTQTCTPYNGADRYQVSSKPKKTDDSSEKPSTSSDVDPQDPWKSACWQPGSAYDRENEREVEGGDESELDGESDGEVSDGDVPMSLDAKRKGGDMLGADTDVVITESQSLFFTEAYEPEWSKIAEYDRLKRVADTVTDRDMPTSLMQTSQGDAVKPLTRVYHVEALALTPPRLYDAYARELLEQINSINSNGVYKEVLFAHPNDNLTQQIGTYKQSIQERLQYATRMYLSNGFQKEGTFKSVSTSAYQIEDIARLTEFIGVCEFINLAKIREEQLGLEEFVKHSMPAAMKNTMKAWAFKTHDNLTYYSFPYEPINDTARDKRDTKRSEREQTMQALNTANFIRTKYNEVSQQSVRLFEPSNIRTYRFALLRIGDDLLIVVKSFIAVGKRGKASAADPGRIVDVDAPNDASIIRLKMVLTVMHPSKTNFVDFLKSSEGASMRASLKSLEGKINTILNNAPFERRRGDEKPFNAFSSADIFCANVMNIHPSTPMTYESQLDAACVRLSQLGQLNENNDNLWEEARPMLQRPLDANTDKNAILKVHVARIACGRRVLPPSLPLDLPVHLKFASDKWRNAVYSPLQLAHLPKCGFKRAVFDMLRRLVQMPSILEWSANRFEGIYQLLLENPSGRE